MPSYKEMANYFDYVVYGETCFTEFHHTVEVPIGEFELANKIAKAMRSGGFVDVRIIDLKKQFRGEE